VGKGVAVGTGVGDEIGVGGGSGPFICFLQLEIKTAKIITAIAMIPVETFFIVKPPKEKVYFANPQNPLLSPFIKGGM